MLAHLLTRMLYGWPADLLADRASQQLAARLKTTKTTTMNAVEGRRELLRMRVTGAWQRAVAQI